MTWTPVWRGGHGALMTSTFGRGKRGTQSTGWLWCFAWVSLAAQGATTFCVVGVARPDIDFCLASQAWYVLTATFVFLVVRSVMRMSAVLCFEDLSVAFHVLLRGILSCVTSFPVCVG